MEKAKIELQNISKSYYSEAAVTQALRKINLTFVQGEFIAITGESGSGKSTLLNIIGGMDTFDEGEMLVNGRPTFQYTENDWEEYRRNQIGYIFQDYSLIGHYTALDNITAALLIMGKSKEEASGTAMEYLKRVGLKGYETHPATELSSGQKQRLSIARALAKNTGIIIADEPTGNLDSETGRQIVELLKELSKDSLVIMVTHNYSQAEPYVTRKIRLHEGTIVSDVTSNTDNTAITGTNTPASTAIQENNEYTSIPFKEKITKCITSSIKHNKLAMWFSHLNIKTQPGRTTLFTTFLLIISIVSFLLIGELHVKSDDIFTKEYSEEAFLRKEPKRIIAEHIDNSVITEEDLEEINEIRYIETTDPCSYANDINFYLEDGKDYKFIYGQKGITGFGQGVSDGGKTVSFLNTERFMMSSKSITEKDLEAGSLPQSRNEIVIYSEDQGIIGTSQTCYFTAANIWDTDEYYKTDLTISGILKEETDQVYFSSELCNMLSNNINSGEFLICSEYNDFLKDFKQKLPLIPVINDELTGNEMRISKKFYNKYQRNNLILGKNIFRFRDYDKDNNTSYETQDEEVSISPSKFNSSSSSFLETSEEFYYKYLTDNSIQVSIYISSYAKTSQVLHSLEKKNYKAVSTYRVSAGNYLENLVNERLVIICICSLGLVTLLAAGVLILRSLLKIRIKDYFVLKFIGMELNSINKTCYHEICLYSIFAMAFALIIMFIIKMFNIEIISEIIWYYTFGAYMQFFLYNLLLSLLAAKAFNKILRGRLQV
ncbi:MAG: ABC transporter ATP-binding protein [Lachnospiraceae bacterium]|nr:ABC transporter ATP-binding protein [Lachnospiraceae bacterium]